MTNVRRQRAIATLLARHKPITNVNGKTIGCSCGVADMGFDHCKHLASVVEGLIDAALDAAFADHSRSAS